MFDPRTYLQVDLPRLLARTRMDQASGPVIQMMVVDRSDCNFSYRMTPEGVRVREGIADDSDVMLAFVSEDLEAFSGRRLDTARALRSQRLKVMGDESVLLWLAERLSEAAVAR